MDSSDDDDAASDAPPLGDSCHLSLGMGSSDDDEDNHMTDGGNSDGPIVHQPAMISLEVPTLSPPVQIFWDSTQEEPFKTALQEWLLKKRPQQLGTTSTDTSSRGRRFETPSAFAAMERGNEQRLDFSRLVEDKGSEEQKKLWMELSPELGDAFLTRLFLPEHFSTSNIHIHSTTPKQHPTDSMADTTNTTPDDYDAAWNDLCVNPQKEALDSGRAEGRQAGLKAGFRDGRSIGILKGVEYGMEVGFIRGALQVVWKSLSTSNDDQNQNALEDSSQMERIQKTAALLSEMLHRFPSPDQIFQQSQHPDTNFDDNGGGELDPHNDSEENLGAHATDLVPQMQAIRSKFKLLCVQMRWSNFSLKSIMDTAKQDESRTAGENGDPEGIIVQETDW